MKRFLCLLAVAAAAFATRRARPVLSNAADHADLPLAGGRLAPTCTCASSPRSPQKYLGQTIIVENKPGGSGMIGPANMAKTARPDGYTVSQLPVSAFRVPHMQKVDWDPLADFTYIIGITGYTFGVVVKADSPFKTFQDVIDYARANPGKFAYASTGNGTSPHLLMEEVAQKTGVQFLHVPFKGNADSTQALMGGHVMAQSDATGWGRHVDAGVFRLLVTFGEKRTKLERADGERARRRHRVLLAVRHRRRRRAWSRSR